VEEEHLDCGKLSVCELVKIEADCLERSRMETRPEQQQAEKWKS
jgi:hypothetical protein